MQSLAAVSLPSDGTRADPCVPVSDRDLVSRLVRHVFAGGHAFESRYAEGSAVDEIDHLVQQALEKAAAGATARGAGQESKAEDCFRQAFNLMINAVNRIAADDPAVRRQNLLHQAIRYALDCGEAKEARRLMAIAGRTSGSPEATAEWEQFHDESAWSDIWLIAAVRRDPPDEKALDALVERYWKPLSARCQILTMNHHKAGDLAQEAWCRVLRSRHALNPGGNFPAYLMTVATNLWRDSHRSARRAGAMADHQLASLDAVLEADSGNATSLADILPDLNGLEADRRKLLMMDIDRALEQLAPLMRDVLVSRFLANESCAEIGRRYGRTEQSVSGWIRQAVQEMKALLTDSNSGAVPKHTHE